MTLVITLVVAVLSSALLLIVSGVDPKTATVIPVVMVAIVVACVVPSRSGTALGRRALHALAVFLASGGGGPR
ncbi:hypothetical protein AB0M12_40455 [Nocardia vinacea]|uniref:hypothetical protein n=1 Tax=Nocardia vinacea TaxID=96468 RepID=UPI003439E3FD